MHSGISNPQDFTWQGFTLTPATAMHIRELVAKQPGMASIHLDVKQADCAGSSYVLDSVSEPDKDDLLFEHDSARLFVPLQTIPFIGGTEVNFVREGPNRIFEFHSPKAQNECDYGESFGVQMVPCLVMLKQLTVSKPEPAAR